MNEYQKMLHEIEAKKRELEQRIAAAVQAELTAWREDTKLPIKSVYIDVADVSYLSGSKEYVVSNAIVDIDYKP